MLKYIDNIGKYLKIQKKDVYLPDYSIFMFFFLFGTLELIISMIYIIMIFSRHI